MPLEAAPSPTAALPPRKRLLAGLKQNGWISSTPSPCSTLDLPRTPGLSGTIEKTRAVADQDENCPQFDPPRKKPRLGGDRRPREKFAFPSQNLPSEVAPNTDPPGEEPSASDEVSLEIEQAAKQAALLSKRAAAARRRALSKAAVAARAKAKAKVLLEAALKAASAERQARKLVRMQARADELRERSGRMQGKRDNGLNEAPVRKAPSEVDDEELARQLHRELNARSSARLARSRPAGRGGASRKAEGALKVGSANEKKKYSEEPKQESSRSRSRTVDQGVKRESEDPGVSESVPSVGSGEVPARASEKLLLKEEAGVAAGMSGLDVLAEAGVSSSKLLEEDVSLKKRSGIGGLRANSRCDQ